MFEDFSESEVLDESQSCPSSEKDIDEKCEQDQFWVRENKRLEERPLHDPHTEKRRGNGLKNPEERRLPPLLCLEIEKTLRESRHDEENEDRIPRECDPEKGPETEQKNQCDTHNRNDDGDFGNIEQSPPAHKCACRIPGRNDKKEEYHSVPPPQCKETQRHNGWRVEAECCDSDDLFEEGQYGRNNGEHEEENYRLTPDPLREHKAHDGREDIPRSHLYGRLI